MHSVYLSLTLITFTIVFHPFRISAAVLNVGILVPWSQSQPVGPSMAAAYRVGLDRVRSLDLLPGHTINFLWRDTGCKNLQGVASAYTLYELFHADISAYIGPICCVVGEPLAVFAGAIDVPVVTIGCPLPTTVRRERMPTLSSVFGGSVATTARLFDGLMETMGWRHVAVITTVESAHAMALAEAVVARMMDSQRTVLDVRIKSSVRADIDDVDPEHYDKMRNIVTYLKKETRSKLIILLF